MNFKLPDETSAIGYAGIIGDTGIFKTVENICNNSNGEYGFINNVAENILNTSVIDAAGNEVTLWDKVIKVVGEKYCPLQAT